MNRAFCICSLICTLSTSICTPAQAQASKRVLEISGASKGSIPVYVSDGREFIALDALKQHMSVGLVTSSTGRVSASLEGVVVRFYVDSTLAYVNGAEFDLSAPPKYIQEKYYLPVSFFLSTLPKVAPSKFLANKDKYTLRLKEEGNKSASGVSTPKQVATTKAPAASPDKKQITPKKNQPVASAKKEAEKPRSPVTPSEQKVAGSRTETGWHVVVDAGHGGVDPGMVGVTLDGNRKLYEKHITLGVSKKLQDSLEARGIKVTMTRTKDTLIALGDRGKIANNKKADLFVSLHVNAANPASPSARTARGFETYFLSEAKTVDAKRLEQLENDVVRYEAAEKVPENNNPLRMIIADMAQNEYLRESSTLAENVQGQLKVAVPSRNLGVKQANFKVLVTAFMPAVLVEMGFGTNESDARYMASTKGQEEMAGALATGIADYLKGYASRQQQDP